MENDYNGLCHYLQMSRVSYVGCYMWGVICGVSYVGCYMWGVICGVLYVGCYSW